MKIAVDVMGGDFAPKEILLGAKNFAQTKVAELILVGDEAKIREAMPELPPGCEIEHTPEYIEMGEAPTHALRKKKNASIVVSARLVKEGRAQAFLSAGSTGAQMAASLLEIGRIPGIERPGVAVVFPTFDGRGVVILDVGANVDCKPLHLLQFGLMGSAYFEKIFKCENPKVGLLNVGAETGKGNDLSKATYPLLEKSGLNFIGNIEADRIFEGKANVIVCDGFVGNVLLKSSEGVSEAVVGAIREGISKAGISEGQAKVIFSCLRRFSADAPEYSAAPLLGIAGCSVVCHGKSKSPVITNALNLAVRYASTDVVGLISRNLSKTEREKVQS